MEATRRFRSAGVAQFAGAVLSTLKEVLAGEHRRPDFSMFALTVLQMMLIRAVVEYGLKMAAYLQEVVQFSSVAQRIHSPPGEVDGCSRRAHCVKKKKKKRLCGCRECKRRFVLAVRGTVQVMRRVLNWSNPTQA